MVAIVRLTKPARHHCTCIVVNKGRNCTDDVIAEPMWAACGKADIHECSLDVISVRGLAVMRSKPLLLASRALLSASWSASISLSGVSSVSCRFRIAVALYANLLDFCMLSVAFLW